MPMFTGFSRSFTVPCSVAARLFPGVLAALAVAPHASAQAQHAAGRAPAAASVRSGCLNSRYAVPALNASATSVAVADFNGDGHADVATGSALEGCQLFSSNAAGRLPLQPIALGVGTRLASADLDADGDVDLIATLSGGTTSSNVRVYANDGTGNFTQWAPVSLPNAPSSMCSADLDGDGDVDVACALPGTAAVAVLLNDGSGHFSAPTLLGAGSGPVFVTSADFDGNGSADLAATTSDNQALVWLNQGGSAFGAPVGWFAGADLSDIAGADVDGDGDADLICSNDASMTLSILLNQGNASFGAPLVHSLTVPPLSFDVGDVDGDGHLDVVSHGHQDPFGVTVSLGLGNGTFWLAHTYERLGAGYAMTLADLDGDGDLDALSPADGNVFAGYTVHLTNDGSGAFSHNVELPIPSATQTGVLSADFSGDGVDDVLAYGDHGNPTSEARLVLFRGDGQGGFTQPSTTSSGKAHAISCAAGDFNGDGLPDVVMSSYGTVPHSLQVFLNQGGGAFGAPMGLNLPLYAGEVSAFDVDTDGDTDIAISISTGGSGQFLSVYLNQGGANFAAPVNSATTLGSVFRMAPVDMDGDGDLDLAVSMYSSAISGTRVAILDNLHNGQFAESPAIFSVAGQTGSDILVADADLDGDFDLAVCFPSQIVVLTQQGSGTWTTQSLSTDLGLEGGAEAGAWADVDHNGYPDLVACHINRRPFLIRNTAYGFREPELYWVPGFPRGVAFLNANGDGLPDVAIATLTGVSILPSVCP